MSILLKSPMKFPELLKELKKKEDALEEMRKKDPCKDQVNPKLFPQGKETSLQPRIYTTEIYKLVKTLKSIMLLT